MPTSPVHGDFTNWNLVLDTNSNVWIIDYENVGLGPPYFDFFHFSVQEALLTRNPVLSENLIKDCAEHAKISVSVAKQWYAAYHGRQLASDLQSLRDHGSHRKINLLIQGKKKLLSDIIEPPANLQN